MRNLQYSGIGGMGMDVKIIVATHKKYPMPDDPIYLPVHCGREGKDDIGYQGDDTGNNISAKNPYFAELTGLYWAWKNLRSDYIGLVHYRRHFGHRARRGAPFSNVLSHGDIALLLGRIKVFLPQKRRYYIETLYSHYAHIAFAEHLDITREIISELYPEYIESFNEVVCRRWGYMFNMMIMQEKLVDEYCTWLFDILFELKNRVDSSQMSDFHLRFCARVGEILLNVWLECQVEQGRIKRSEIRELPYVHMEKVDWIKKGGAFLKAKFLHQKYERSF